MFKINEAVREQVKLMVGLAGPAGSGKSLSALKLAYGMTNDWSKICYIDTENNSALYYAGDNKVFPTGNWKHLPFGPDAVEGGYHPNNWIGAVDFVKRQPDKFEVLILDSISHEWDGRGGCLELAEKVGGKTAFAGWKVVTPLHAKFIDKMRHCGMHIIATMRSKQDYVVEQNEKGKMAPKKVGLKSTQREGTDYEFGVIFDIEINHLATANKDRTGLFADRGPFQIEPSTGKELLAWANSGRAASSNGTENKVNPKAENTTQSGGGKAEAASTTGNTNKNPSIKYDATNINHQDWLEKQLTKHNLLKHAKEVEQRMIGKGPADLTKIISELKPIPPKTDDFEIPFGSQP